MNVPQQGRSSPRSMASASCRFPQTPTIAVFGEALIDEFAASRIVGGAPFNVARALACFGCAPLMVTRIGRDSAAELIQAELQRFRMRQAAIQSDPQYPTGRVMVHQTGSEHSFMILPDQAYDFIEAAPAIAALNSVLPAILYYGTLAQRSHASWSALQALLNASPARRFLDLNLRDGQVKRSIVLDAVLHADVLKVNQDELEILVDWAFGSVSGSASAEQGPVFEGDIARLMQAFSLSELIVTLGAEGYRHFTAQGQMIVGRVAAPNKAIVDTVGAGDAFSAIYLVGQLHGWPLAVTLERASAFASAVCGIAGAVAADLSFYQSWVTQWFGPDALLFGASDASSLQEAG